MRIVFCLFADDTGVFEPRDILFDFLESRTRQDGSDLGAMLAQLFQVLNTPDDDRTATLDEDLARFPYVNGDLFEEPLRIPAFDASMREKLLDACRFDWSNISPAIFGALFQSVMDPVQRRKQGAHYTTEKNILKVIEPLFLDDLRAEFRAPEAPQGQPSPCGSAPLSAKARQPDLLRSGVRLRELPHHRLPRATGAGDPSPEGNPPGQATRRARPRPVGRGCGSVLRHRTGRIPGSHRRDGAVDDGTTS